MRTTVLHLAVSGIALAFAGQAAAQTAPSASPSEAPRAASPASGDIAEIVVTASRRAESLREVPIAVSAYGADKLREGQFASLTDLVKASPNVNISVVGTNANVAIRGIGNNTSGAGADAGVAVHADGVPLGQASLVLSTFLDVSRVEILRGPQGTLFGRNATGGAVNIIPNSPTEDLHYGVDISAGVDPTMIRSSAYVSGPLTSSGTLLGRISVAQNYNQGFTRNIIPSIQGVEGPSHAEPIRLDDNDSSAVRGQLEWRPSSTFKTRLLVEHLRQDDNGQGVFYSGTPDPSLPLPALLQGGVFGDASKRETYANVGSRHLKATTANLISDVTLGAGNLKATLSYVTSDNLTLQDGDGADLDFTHTGYRNKADQYYAELLYTSDPSAPFTYVLGSNFYKENLTQNISVPIGGFPMPVNLGGTIKTTSYAAFARGQYELDMGLKLFVGGRYTRDKKELDEYNNYVGTGEDQKSWRRFTYEFGASYDFTNQITGYAKYATGYKGGGYSAGSLQAAVDPETNVNIEAGLKGRFADWLQGNLAAFHMKYDDLQVNQVTGASSSLTNAAKATIYGVEAELVVRPVKALRIDLSGSWINAKFDEFVTTDSSRPSLGQLNLKGNQLPLAPRFNTSTGVYYDVPVASGTVTLGARYDWKSKVYFSEFNIPISSQKAIGKVDLSINYKTDDGRWTASVFAINATNEQVKSNVLIVSALLGSLGVTWYQPSRQFGASIGYHF